MTANTLTQGGGSVEVAIVGAGFAGLYMLHKMRQEGFAAKVFEAAPNVGGTWYWNRYPGARCDVESMQYSYSFDEDLQQEWCWTERFATQPEILKYINHVADRFDLRKDIQFNTRITSARFDEAARRWHIADTDGRNYDAQYLVLGTGCLSTAKIPNIPGLSEFRGAVYHTGNWPHEPVDFTGKRVAVLGTGSSGIQAIPEIARQAEHLYVLQRTPNFSVPARNAPLSDEQVAAWKADYPALRRRAREETRSGTLYDTPLGVASDFNESARRAEFEKRWAKGGANFMLSFTDLITDEESNRSAADFVRGKIKAIVKDPIVAETLIPRDYPIFAKRICVDTDYFATYNLANVDLVDLKKTPLEGITPRGFRTSDREIEADAIVFATGFDAITGALTSMDIHSTSGETLKETWKEGPKAYLGLMTAGFPNMFMITGPGSPSVLSNVVVSIEQHVEWITECLSYMRRIVASRIEPTFDAQEQWVSHVRDIANQTLYPKAASWYMGANIPGKPRVFMPYLGVDQYRKKCYDVAGRGYPGFLFDSAEDVRASA
jgi:cyclohexanone monooxygenase